MASTLDRIRKDRRVEIVDDERAEGNGVIVTLRKGWSFDQAADNRVLGEDSPIEMLKSLKRARPYAGPYES